VNLGRLITAQVPDLDETEVTDLVLLRKEYGIGAREAWMNMPAWEVQLLLGAVRGDEPAEDVGDPFEDGPPSEFRDLFNQEESD
jgi:hypothetical protein